MARISKTGNLSGAVGNLVFVSNGDYQYVRSKPGKVKQSAETKKAASVFGKVSARDKIFRQALVEQITLVTDNRYAARHRARMAKTLAPPDSSQPLTTELNFQNPEALVGFDFNNTLIWTKCTQFYPEFSMNEEGSVACKIPALVWNKQIKALKKTRSAVLKFEAFAVNPTDEDMKISVLATFLANISAVQSQEATTWSFATQNHGDWILVVAALTFAGEISPLNSTEKSASTYLWARNKRNV